jgi:hypothetical protein
MTTLFSDGFECPPNTAPDTFTPWNGTAANAVLAIQDSVKYTGTYALSVTADAAEYGIVKKTVADANEIYIQARVRFSAVPSAGTSITFMEIGTANLGVIFQSLGVVNTGAGAKFFSRYRSSVAYTDVYSATTPLVDTWYLLEFYLKTDNGAGAVKAYIDGVEDANLAASSLTNLYTLETVGVGIDYWVSNSYASIVYVDDVVVADAYIGPALWNLTVNSSPITGVPFTVVVA